MVGLVGRVGEVDDVGDDTPAGSSLRSIDSLTKGFSKSLAS